MSYHVIYYIRPRVTYRLSPPLVVAGTSDILASSGLYIIRLYRAKNVNGPSDS